MVKLAATIAMTFSFAAFAGGAPSAPPHWFLTSQAGQEEARRNYIVSVDDSIAYEGSRSALLRSVSPPGGQPNRDAFGTLMQETVAAPFKGKRIRFSGYLRTRDLSNLASLWMRAEDDDGVVVAFSNLQSSGEHPSFVRDSSEWTRVEMVMDIPAAATALFYGVRIAGSGAVWMDHLQFDILGETHPTAIPAATMRNPPTPRASLGAAPANLDFEDSGESADQP